MASNGRIIKGLDEFLEQMKTLRDEDIYKILNKAEIKALTKPRDRLAEMYGTWAGKNDQVLIEGLDIGRRCGDDAVDLRSGRGGGGGGRILCKRAWSRHNGGECQRSSEDCPEKRARKRGGSGRWHGVLLRGLLLRLPQRCAFLPRRLRAHRATRSKCRRIARNHRAIPKTGRTAISSFASSAKRLSPKSR